jgi:hypothetical protein
VGSVDKGLGQIELTAIAQVSRERFEYLHERSLRHPLLQTAMAGLVGRVLPGQRLPRSAGPQDPKHAIQDTARRNARTPLAVMSTLDHGDQRLDDSPLLVGEFHPNV